MRAIVVLVIRACRGAATSEDCGGPSTARLWRYARDDEKKKERFAASMIFVQREEQMARRADKNALE